jgi:hypothetical protein
MKTIHKRFLLFLGLCIPVRLAIAYISSIVSANILFLMGLVALIPAIGWLSIYFFELRKTGGEVFGNKIWWDDLRPIHALDYLIFSYLAIHDSKYSSYPLYFDAVLGLISFFIYHYS